MKALITGAGGQMGQALVAKAPFGIEIVALDRGALDITDARAVEQCLANVRPTHVFNAAAWTAVDAAEKHEKAASVINAVAVGTVSAAARQTGARFIHLSTDFVFDGNQGRPYTVDDVPNPTCAYGRTKLAGELAAGTDTLIVRTAWIYAPWGNNFVRTMLRLMAERSEISVVADQIGTPTYAPSLASALWQLAQTDARGVLHYTDSGVASWYDFAVAIQEEALELGLLDCAIPILPIATANFPTPARRPAYSVLDKALTWQ